MIVASPFRHRCRGTIVLIVTFLVSGGLAPTGMAQELSPEAPDLETMEAQFEQYFANALEMSEDTEPMHVLSAWGTVFMSAVMLDRVRRMTTGESPPAGDGEAVADRVLERWRKLRPEAAGPDLFLAFRIEDPEEKRAAILGLLDRYPDDPLVVWQATRELRQVGEISRANEVAETFVSRNPSSTVGYQMLAQAASGNETRLAEVLDRWADAVPGDPDLVRTWMSSKLPQQDSSATHRLLSEFFARQRSSADSLEACRLVFRKGDPSFAQPARDCVVRIAADPDVPPLVSKNAISVMAQMATADGDWSALMDSLDLMEPASAARALISAASGLETPERCSDRIELLAVASEVLGDYVSGYQAIASALKSCSESSKAQDLYLSLLRQAPANRVGRIIGTWIVKVNDVYQGEVPGEVAGLLESQLRQEPGEASLFKALDLVYQVQGTGGERFDLLRRWRQQAPSSFRGEQAEAYAWMLIERAEPEAAVELLEQQIDSQFNKKTVEMLWELYLGAGDLERADRLAADLIAADDEWRARVGHTLAARSAALEGDLATAEGHYWQALEGDHPSQEVAVELLHTVALGGDDTVLESTARRVCEETDLARGRGKVPECAADLLARAGHGEAAARLLIAQSADLPEDVESLRKLASTAQAAGQPEVAERALRRVLELDPLNEGSWVNYGVFLERQGRVEEVEDLLERSRELFSPPPSFLSRAAGRALTAAGRPRQAVEVLLEARAALPDTAGGEWTRDWINHELRQAYQQLGEQIEFAAPAAGPTPMPAFRTSDQPAIPDGTAQELRMAAEDLHSGEGGRYDPEVAAELFARAADMGDPPATYRVALLRALGSDRSSSEVPTTQQLYDRAVRSVEDLAAAGDAYAQYLVGTAALIGLGGSADPATARQWLELAATQGESWAWHNLAWMEETGRGFAGSDPNSALDSYRRASEAGNTVSMIDFARLALTPYGSKALCEEGLQWLERAARVGNARAAALLGKRLFYGQLGCVPRDPQAALEWLEAGAATHQPGATYDLAMALLVTGDDEASRAQGMTLLEKAATHPDALIAETLAFLHATGLAGPRHSAKAHQFEAEAARLGSDGFPFLRRELEISEAFRDLIEKGLRRLEALAEQSDPEAMAFLAHAYYVGLGEEVDPEHTVSLARRAAASGQAAAMRVLSSAYKRGEGVEVDPSESLQWTRRCAEAGDSFCMMYYGNDLMKGEEVERDLEAGLSWLRRSGEAGNWWAVADLGRLYDEGWYGLPPDPDEAVLWKRRLADLGDKEAAGWLLYREYR